MEVDAIRTLYGYNRWANTQLLATAAQLPPDRLRLAGGASFDSILGTLAHVLGAEITWLSRWQGATPRRIPGIADFADLAVLRTRWDEHQHQLDLFLQTLTPSRFQAPFRYTNTRGQSFAYPLWQQMLHVVNHGTHHRSEVATMLTAAGSEPPPSDLLVYYDAVGNAE